MPETETGTRCGFIAVIGAPNAGKSTLVNTLVGAKVAIVNRKVQTTRTTLRGIAVVGASQLVFIDTPGIFAPRRRLDRAMVDAAWGGAGDADQVLLVVDAAKGIDEDVERILGKLQGGKAQLLALNKIDRVKKERLLDLAAELNSAGALCHDVHDLRAQRRRRCRPESVSRALGRTGPLALSGRRDLRCADAGDGRRDHPREDV